MGAGEDTQCAKGSGLLAPPPPSMSPQCCRPPKAPSQRDHGSAMVSGGPLWSLLDHISSGCHINEIDLREGLQQMKSLETLYEEEMGDA